METFYNGFTLQIAPGTFPLSTDSMALAKFVSLPKNARVLDLGSGCGTLGILLCAKDPGCTVTGIEIDPVAHEMALRNITANGLENRLKSICADLTQISAELPTSSFDLCISNPPYFTGGFLSKSTPTARHEQHCSLEDLVQCAAKALKFGGDFYLVHKPERLAEIFACTVSHKLEPKRLNLLRHKEDGPVSLVLVQCRKGGKPGLLWEEAALHDRQGNPTEFWNEMYHKNEENAKP